MEGGPGQLALGFSNRGEAQILADLIVEQKWAQRQWCFLLMCLLVKVRLT